jgi:hypothetical protein
MRQVLASIFASNHEKTERSVSASGLATLRPKRPLNQSLLELFEKPVVPSPVLQLRIVSK